MKENEEEDGVIDGMAGIINTRSIIDGFKWFDKKIIRIMDISQNQIYSE